MFGEPISIIMWVLIKSGKSSSFCHVEFHSFASGLSCADARGSHCHMQRSWSTVRLISGPLLDSTLESASKVATITDTALVRVPSVPTATTQSLKVNRRATSGPPATAFRFQDLKLQVCYPQQYLLLFQSGPVQVVARATYCSVR